MATQRSERVGTFFYLCTSGRGKMVSFLEGAQFLTLQVVFSLDDHCSSTGPDYLIC